MRALERGAKPPVRPHASRDELFGQRRLGVDVVVLAEARRGMTLLDALDVVVGIDWKVDLVENLTVGRRQLAVGVLVALVERIGEPAQCAKVALRIDRGVRDAVGDDRPVAVGQEDVRHDRTE